MSKRERHTAPYLLSYFLCSNDQFKYKELTGNYQAILRYMYDIMEMNFHKTGHAICDKSYKHIGKFSGTSNRTVIRAIEYFIKHNLINVVKKIPRSTCHYGIGSYLESRATMAPDDTKLVPPWHQNWCHHGTHIREDKKAASLQGEGGLIKKELTLQERLDRMERISKPH